MNKHQRELLERFVAGVHSPGGPDRDAMEEASVFIRALLGDRVAKDYVDHFRAKGRPPAYGVHTELKQRALAYDMAAELKRDPYEAARDKVVRRRNVNKGTVEQAWAEYKYDDLTGQDYDALRRQADSCWAAYRSIMKSTPP